VVIGDVFTTKGLDLKCSSIEVSGFSTSSACGVEAPEAGEKGTFYLSTLILGTDGTCKATLNTKGVYVGMSRKVSLGTVDLSTAPPRCRQECGKWLPVADYKPVRAWPPTPDSECVSANEGTTIRSVTVDGSHGWKRHRSYHNLDGCFTNCLSTDGYMYIVENRQTDSCFWYNSDNAEEWGFEDATTDEVLADCVPT